MRKVIRSQATEFKYVRGIQPAPKLGEWVEVFWLSGGLDVAHFVSIGCAEAHSRLKPLLRPYRSAPREASSDSRLSLLANCSVRADKSPTSSPRSERAS